MMPIAIAMLSSPLPWRQWRVWSNCQAVLVAEHRDAGPETLRAVATPVNSRSGAPQTSDALGVIAHSAGRQVCLVQQPLPVCSGVFVVDGKEAQTPLTGDGGVIFTAGHIPRQVVRERPADPVV